MILMAQSVPSATVGAVPRRAPGRVGKFGGDADPSDGAAAFWLDSDVAATHAVEVALLPPESAA